MTENDIRDALIALIQGGEDIDETDLADARAYDLQEAGFLTRDTGVFIGTEDGSKFMLTIKRLQ